METTSDRASLSAAPVAPDVAPPAPSRPLALVTGASSGIGAAFARRLAAKGHDLVLVARRRQRLEQLAAELRARHGVQVAVIAADLSTAEGLETTRRAVVSGPPLALLVNSAGFGTRAFFAETDERCAQAMLQLHNAAPIQLSRAALPAMLAARRGRIINVSSLAAFFTTSRYVMYSATKACLNMFCEGLQAELLGSGVSVQAICPGLTRTEFFDTDEYRDFKYQQVPERFWMTPEQVVDEALASRAVIVIPGRHFRWFVEIIRAPLIGPLLRWALARANKDGLY
jgi:uncharacterized protein